MMDLDVRDETTDREAATGLAWLARATREFTATLGARDVEIGRDVMILPTSG
jgi:hypothetical protein